MRSRWVWDSDYRVRPTDLVKEFRSNGPEYKVRVHTKMRAAYSAHYRNLLPRILEALELRSNNAAHRPVLDAIDLIKKYRGNRQQYFTADEVPIEDVVRNKWRDVVVETSPDGTARIDRINYEICVLQALRERLRCKRVLRLVDDSSGTRQAEQRFWDLLVSSNKIERWQNMPAPDILHMECE